MFATFNLQLMPTATLDAGTETPDIPGALPVLTADSMEPDLPGFARLLQVQVDAGVDADVPRGDFLPQAGNLLPEAESIPTIVDELPAVDLTAPLVAEQGPEAPAADLALKLTPAPAMTPSNGDIGPVVPSQPIAPTLPSAPVKGKQGPVLDAQKTTSPIRVDVTVQDPAKAVTPPKVLLPDAPVATNLTPPREMPQPDRSRDRRDIAIPRAEQPLSSREVPVGAGTTVLPETDVVPRVLATADTTVVPDRTVPNNATSPAISTLASAVSQVSGAAPRDTAITPQATTDLVRTPVTDPTWGDRIGQRVVMMAGNQVQQAEIRLTPAELGPVRVQIAVEDGAANVTFQASHAVTREAIEAAMPRLREMLADSGLSLGQANVGGDGVAEGQGDRREAANAAPTGEQTADLTDESQPERQKTVTSDGLIDTFV